MCGPFLLVNDFDTFDEEKTTNFKSVELVGLSLLDRKIMGNKAGGKGKKDPIILTEEDIKSLKINTHYTEEEIVAWHSGFLKDCPTGKLDKKQFLNVYKVKSISLIELFENEDSL